MPASDQAGARYRGLEALSGPEKIRCRTARRVAAATVSGGGRWRPRGTTRPLVLPGPGRGADEAGSQQQEHLVTVVMLAVAGQVPGQVVGVMAGHPVGDADPCLPAEPVGLTRARC
ncbi:MAG: hypothetical protein ACRDTA_25830 [Pseudonocardiaceae bacterium]